MGIALMVPISSYKQYLPPFLWSPESDPEQFLLQYLCIFEAILTGRDDMAAPLRTLQNGQYREYPPYEKIIDQLPDLFNPWRVPVRFLPFLAGSLGLTLDPNWDEYRQRRMIEGASALFQQRWLKRGLYAFLDLYSALQVRPRIAIDDGEAILRGRLLPDGSLPLWPVAFARSGDGPTHVGAALNHPTAAVMAGSGSTRNYIVADAGPQDLDQRRGALWAVALTGELHWTPTPGSSGTLTLAPLNAGEPAPLLQAPIAIAVESDGVYLVLDVAAGQPNTAVIYRYRASATPVRETAITANVLQAAFPVDMVRDPASGRLLVLDQGDIPHGGTTSPRILSVAVPATGPNPVTVFPLGAAAVSPTALVLGTSSGTLLIADAGQPAIQPDQPVPYPPALQAQLAGDILSMSLTTGATATSLLKSATAGETNLVNPVALSLLSDGSLLILDDGLKNSRLVQIEHNKVIPHTGVLVRPAQVLRINPTSPGAAVEVLLRAPLVQPSRILVDGADIVVLEKGSYLTPITGAKQDWRCQAHSFGVTVDFSRPDFGSSSFDDVLNAQREVFKGLADVLDSEKPAHSSWSFQFQFDPGQSAAHAIEAASPE
jgi:phage tail-like protein